MISARVEAPDIQKRWFTFNRNLDRGVHSGMHDAALHLLEKSREIVPTDTTKLYASGYTQQVPGTSGKDTAVDVGYSDPKAIWVHEDLQKAHGSVFNAKYAAEIAAGKTHRRRPQEQAQFLADPAKDSQVQNEMLSIVAQAAKKWGTIR
jgi:hypothetical protein